MHELNRTIKLVDTLIGKVSAAPATASLGRAIRGLKGASEAPDGSHADVTQYTSVTATVTQHIRRLLAETMTVRSVLVENAKQSSPG